ncbi:hypothetical protein, partial [Vampirovibrio sp.]|uniref:hypothetical protein n=1 Tax=Vampirovibrio sp. TaxID=2717857 RepID=UPI003593B8D7
YMFPAHQPLTALCIGIGVITATVGLQCLYFGEFYPKKIDHASQTILVAVLAIAISRIFDHFKKARNRTE